MVSFDQVRLVLVVIKRNMFFFFVKIATPSRFSRPFITSSAPCLQTPRLEYNRWDEPCMGTRKGPIKQTKEKLKNGGK